MNGAGNGTRTRDPDLGKVVLYQLSYSRLRGFCNSPACLTLIVGVLGERRTGSVSGRVGAVKKK